MLRLLSFWTLWVILIPLLPAQDDLMNLLEEETEPTTNYTIATFKGTRVINAQSVEQPAAGVLMFLIQHRFGRLNSGAYELWGLDQANIRLGLEYGITPWLAIGFGRTNVQKTFDGFVKAKIFRQSTGKRSFPLSVSWYSSLSINTLRWADPDRQNFFTSRMAYTHQLLVARKFGEVISLQLMPTMVHRNFVETRNTNNDVFFIGAGGRIKFSGSAAITFEYFYPLTEVNRIVDPNNSAFEFQAPISLGLDIETGGHVFQLAFSNSRAMTDNIFLTQSDGDFFNGDIHFGFNLSRVFTVIDYTRRNQEKEMREDKKSRW